MIAIKKRWGSFLLHSTWLTISESARTVKGEGTDNAVNRARVQYELTQYSKLPAQLPGTLIELLETALTSSRYALNLKQDNAEAL